MSYIPKLDKNYLNIDEELNEDKKVDFQIQDYIGSGGSSIVVKASSLAEDEKLSIYPGMEMVLKIFEIIE